MKYGLQIIAIDPDINHIFGSARSLGGAVVQPDGDWTPYLPIDEFQNLNGIEPLACASFGTLNCVEVLENKLFGSKNNWSDRFLAKNSGTDIRKGNDPHSVAEYLRNEGTPVQAQWDFTPDIDTFEKFYAMLTSTIKILAKQFIGEYKFGHEYVGTSVASLREALKYSPLGISVYAWLNGPDNIYYKPTGERDVHWCMLYKIESPDIGYIFDSYDNTHKRYHLTDVQIAKRYSLIKKVNTESQGWIDYLVNLVLTAFGLPQKKTLPPNLPSTAIEKIHTAAVSYIGKDASPKNLAPQELSCAEGVSNIIHSVFPDFPKDILSTETLFQTLKKSPHFKGVLDPSIGTIVVSPRTPSIPGHTGIYVNADSIASNDSRDGIFRENYNRVSWRKTFIQGRRLKGYLFDAV